MNKRYPKSLKLAVAYVALWLIVSLPTFITGVLPLIRAPEKGLVVTKFSWFQTGLLSHLMEGSDGSLYTDTTKMLVRIDEDGSKRFYHLPAFFPYVFNMTEDGNIQLYRHNDGIVYVYDQYGKYIEKYESEPIEQLRHNLYRTEKNGMIYKLSNEGRPWRSLIKVYEAANEDDAGEVILWTFTPKVGRITQTVLVVAHFVILSALGILKRKERQKTRSPHRRENPN